MFNRIISGLHASINSHIFEYFMDTNSKDFSANVDVYFDRVGNYNERIENIYFTFSLLVRLKINKINKINSLIKIKEQLILHQVLFMNMR